jgi:YbbR domain-containing protein
MPLRQLIFHNFWLKVLSLIFALLIWAVVQIKITNGNLSLIFQPGVDDTRTFTVPLHLLNSASDTRTLSLFPNQVKVVVEGDLLHLGRLTEGDIRAYIDLIRLRIPADGNVLVRVDLPDGVHLRQLVPEKVQVRNIPAANP